MSSQLSGHKNTVLCVATSHHTGHQQVISGSEGGEIRLWSLDGSGIQHVQSVEEDVTSLCCSALNPDVFYASIGENILIYDCRKLQEPTQTLRFNEEEINQLALNGKETYLAAVDDSGQVKIIDIYKKKLYKTLRKHTNICSSVVFRPQRKWDLFTGGYDSKLIQWDFSRSRATCVVDMSELGPVVDTPGPYLLNPPFVHSLAISVGGNLLACGTENALVQVFSVTKGGLELVETLNEHTQGVSQVHFPVVDDRIFISGGNDGMIHIWDANSLSSRSVVCNGDGPASHSASGQTALNSVAGEHRGNPKRSTLNHGKKINWITSGRHGSNNFIVAADNTTNLTLYPFPH